MLNEKINISKNNYIAQYFTYKIHILQPEYDWISIFNIRTKINKNDQIK